MAIFALRSLPLRSKDRQVKTTKNADPHSLISSHQLSDKTVFKQITNLEFGKQQGQKCE